MVATACGAAVTGGAAGVARAVLGNEWLLGGALADRVQHQVDQGVTAAGLDTALITGRPGVAGVVVRPRDHPFPAPDPLQRLELMVLRGGIGPLRQQVSQHAVGNVLRPTHRLRNAVGRVFSQAVDNILGRGRFRRWRLLA